MDDKTIYLTEYEGFIARADRLHKGCRMLEIHDRNGKHIFTEECASDISESPTGLQNRFQDIICQLPQWYP